MVLSGRDWIKLNLWPGKDRRPEAEGWSRHGGDRGYPQAIQQLQEVQGLGFLSSEISACLELFLQSYILKIYNDSVSLDYIHFIWHIVKNWLRCILYCRRGNYGPMISSRLCQKTYHYTPSILWQFEISKYFAWLPSHSTRKDIFCIPKNSLLTFPTVKLCKCCLHATEKISSHIAFQIKIVIMHMQCSQVARLKTGLPV